MAFKIDADTVICSKTFKPCHMMYINTHQKQIDDLIDLKIALDKKRDQIITFEYWGPVNTEDGKCLTEDWIGTTKAYSRGQAFKNLQHLYHQEQHLDQRINVRLKNSCLKEV